MNTTPAPQPALPLFYTQVRPLDRVQDADLRIRRGADLRFTATTNAIPLVGEEFPFAASDYPIVFSPAPTPVPVAVVGLERDKNLMVDAAGQWMRRSYIPAYVRRYPFILVEDPDNQKLVLCYEENAPHLSPQGELPMFENGEPSETVKLALDFCMALREQGTATDAFVQALQAQELLQPANVEVMAGGGAKVHMDGFLTIDRQRFMALPAAVIADWHKRQWLDLVYAHFISGLRWQTLADIASA
ncbi:MAG: SapC family protein [Alphaproteobacteria bacterium]